MKIKQLIIIMILITISSCTEDPLNKNSKGYIPILPSYLGGDPINTIIDSITGPVDAIQLIRKSLPGISMSEEDDWWEGQESSVANAVYRVGDNSGYITSVSCNGNSLSAPNDDLKIYNYSWNWDYGPPLSQDINWISVINNETIYDTIAMPNGFDNLSFSVDSINLNEGGTISYNSTSSGDIALYLTWIVPENNSITQYSKFLRAVEDDGSCSISSSDLTGNGIPQNTLLVGFTLYKWNMKSRDYDFGNKKLWTGAIVSKTISVPVE